MACSGHTDVFRHRCVDLGQLRRIKIWHDNKGMFKSSSWFLDKVEIEDDVGNTTAFVCQEWLSKKHGDKATEREVEAWVDPAVAQAEANALSKKAGALERSASKASSKGAPAALRSRKAKGELKALQEEAGAAKDDAEKATARAKKLLGGPGAEEMDYVVTVNTAELPKRSKKGGTRRSNKSDDDDDDDDDGDGDQGDVSKHVPHHVYVELQGEKSTQHASFPRSPSASPSLRSKKSRSRAASTSSTASGTSAAPRSPLSSEAVSTSTGRLYVPAKQNAFAPGSSETVTLRGVDIGRVTRVLIGYDIAGGDDSEDDDDDDGDDSGGGGGDDDDDEKPSGKQGRRSVRTTKKSSSSSSSTRRLKARQSVRAKDTSFVWRVRSVEIKVPSKGEKLTCERTKEEKWMRRKSEADGRVLTLGVTSFEEMSKTVDYELLVTTGDKMGAGTSTDSVQFAICGDKGMTDVLRPSAEHKFERGGTVHLYFTAKDVGLISSLRVKHKSRGLGGAWFLDRVVLLCPEKEVEAMFEWNGWLKAKEEEHDLLPLHPGDDTQSVLLGNDFADSDSVSVASSTMAGRASGTIAVDLKKYKIHVKTGAVSGAGTDANVSCVLFGVRGESRTLKLKSSETHRDKFERGHTDVFEVELPDLGQLTRCRIWHDNARLYASWFLDEVTVVEMESQSSYVFPCYKWLSKSKGDKQVTREIACAAADYRARTGTYKLTIHTADEDGAGTSSQVLATLIGEDELRHAFVLSSEPGKHFQQGAEDEFVFEDVPLLGKVRGCVLELFPPEGKKKVRPWRVDKLEVVEVGSGDAVTLFNTQKKNVIEEVGVFKTKEAMSTADEQRSAQAVSYEVSEWWRRGRWKRGRWRRWKRERESVCVCVCECA